MSEMKLPKEMKVIQKDVDNAAELIPVANPGKAMLEFVKGMEKELNKNEL